VHQRQLRGRRKRAKIDGGDEAEVLMAVVMRMTRRYPTKVNIGMALREPPHARFPVERCPQARSGTWVHDRKRVGLDVVAF